jgi:large subunit ribosomal protein L22
MSFGTKTNERPGTRASVRHVRVSAYKSREILNLIRSKSYGEATDILAFSDRDVARVIRKCLDSAVANAENNDGLDAEELFVSACFADEGPTLKRWRPRARGRATKIRKRTCHITIIVSRYSPEQLAAQSARLEAKGTANASANASASRRDRVAKSKAAADARAEHDHDDHDHDDHDHDHDADVVAEAVAGAGEAPNEVPTEEASEETTADEAPEAETAVADQFEGAAAPLEDGAAPSDDYVIKGNAGSMLYHPEDSPHYGRTIAEVWFKTEEDAQAAGFSLPDGVAKKRAGAEAAEDEDK